jgi:plasmid stability protein
LQKLIEVISCYHSSGIAMAQVIVRQLEEEVKLRLQRRAERHGRSMEAEVREILRNAAKEESHPAARLGSRIAARFRRVGLSADLPELRGHPSRPAELGK